MTQSHTSSERRLRLWPGVAIVLLQWLIRFAIPLIAPDASIFDVPLDVIAMLAGVLGGFAVLLWWLFFSRARWSERLGAVVLMIVAMYVTSRVVDKSIAGGMMGMMLFLYSIPFLSLALVVWAVATANMADGARRVALVAAVLVACAPWAIVRTAGVLGGGSEFHWRWTDTPEERLLARAEDKAPETAPGMPAAAPSQPAAQASRPVESAPPAGAVLPEPATIKAESTPVQKEQQAEWPGFRGPQRDGVVRGVRINTDWAKFPPVPIWRRPIGPGWSSFAVRGDRLYTQEQRGDDEIVASYAVSTGEPVWRHRDAVRFWESNGGAGPRATPTLSGNRVYAFGATGILNALDAASGRLVWSRNAATDTGREVPDWGFASSPLVVDDAVIVAVSGTLAAYDLATGKPRWVGPQHGGSYSSPQRATLGGVPQVLLLTGAGATSVSPRNGELLWEHEWAGNAIVQPAMTPDGDVVINAVSATGGVGTRRLAVTHSAAAGAAPSDGWNVQERWTSTGLKPYFNDFVIHNGYAFGFDGNILACIDLKDGARKWKGGRYGNGQLLLLVEQDLLLVLSEEGELALVRAAPDQFTEIARFGALNAKTWNHPVLVGNLLLVRNGEEMAAFRLP